MYYAYKSINDRNNKKAYIAKIHLDLRRADIPWQWVYDGSDAYIRKHEMHLEPRTVADNCARIFEEVLIESQPIFNHEIINVETLSNNVFKSIPIGLNFREFREII